MIGHFPTPYPDESLYSICARFSERVQYPNSKAILEELYGATTATAVFYLPNRLGFLAGSLPEGTSLTVDWLIDQCTILPFFSAFLPPERVQIIREDMATGHGPAAYMRSGMMASRIKVTKSLRFCPSCKREDEDKFGETYWHRLHQLPGIVICHSHGANLEPSAVNVSVGRNSLLFTSATDAINATRLTPVASTFINHEILMKLARNAAWLLENPTSGIIGQTLQNRYLRLLTERGLATHTGSIRVTKLLDKFREFYSSALLNLLKCEFSGRDQQKTNWLLRLVRNWKHAQHPLHHLLLMQFLGYTAEDFFQMPEELSFFGAGPWPCLNRVAEHFTEPVIQKCILSPRLRDNRPVGNFNCDCGFAYARSGLDSSPDDRFRIGRMISFGSVWEDKLKELWKESSLSLSEIGRRLGVDPLTVRRHAARLKLRLSCGSKRSKPLKRATQLKSESISTAWQKKRQAYRSKWYSGMRQNPKTTLKALRHKLHREYIWLLEHDSAWLKGHRPQTQKRRLPTSSVDWKRRDAEYAVAVRDAVSHLKHDSGRPTQVTKTAIGRAIGTITLLQQKLCKMPLTAQVLAGLVETREQYAVRRIRWAAFLYIEEHVLPREWQLIERANVYRLRTVFEVECAIQAAMKMIESKLSLWQGIQAVT